MRERLDPSDEAYWRYPLTRKAWWHGFIAGGMVFALAAAIALGYRHGVPTVLLLWIGGCFATAFLIMPLMALDAGLVWLHERFVRRKRVLEGEVIEPYRLPPHRR
jgi:hypothetical protein